MSGAASIPPLHTPVEWLFLDVGGVLFDDEPLLDALYRYFGDALREKGVDVLQSEIERVRQELIQTRRSGVYKAVLRHFAPDEEAYRDVLSSFRRWLEPRQAELNPLRGGVPEALETLASRYKLALAANQGAYIHDLLRERGIRDHFSSATISGEIGLAKPDPAFFQRMLEDTGCSAEHAVMVGDSLTGDLLPACELGMRTVRVIAGGDNVSDPAAYHFVSGTIDSLSGLAPLLEQWKR